MARCTDGKVDSRNSARECIARIELDMDTLVWTPGRDFPLARLADRLRCAKCGSRNVAVYFEPRRNSAVL